MEANNQKHSSGEVPQGVSVNKTTFLNHLLILRWQYKSMFALCANTGLPERNTRTKESSLTGQNTNIHLQKNGSLSCYCPWFAERQPEDSGWWKVGIVSHLSCVSPQQSSINTYTQLQDWYKRVNVCWYSFSFNIRTTGRPFQQIFEAHSFADLVWYGPLLSEEIVHCTSSLVVKKKCCFLCSLRERDSLFLGFPFAKGSEFDYFIAMGHLSHRHEKPIHVTGCYE